MRSCTGVDDGCWYRGLKSIDDELEIWKTAESILKIKSADWISSWCIAIVDGRQEVGSNVEWDKLNADDLMTEMIGNGRIDGSGKTFPLVCYADTKLRLA